MEPAWLPRLGMETIHRELVREHGGSLGLREEGPLEAALARPRNRPEAVATTVALCTGDASDEECAAWVRQHLG